MRTLLATLVTVLLSGIVAADGISMTKDHRFTHKRESCYTMNLTKAQIAELELKSEETKRWTVIEMALTKEQTRFLKEKTGKTVTTLSVFENGWNDCSCGAVNIASRFAPDRIEVSNVYLTDEALLQAAKKARDDKARRVAKEEK